MICQLKFYKIKCQKAVFFVNIIDFSDLSDKPFAIIVSCLALL